MEQLKVQRTSRCDLCSGKAGTRVRLGDESGPVRVAICPHCDLPSNLGDPAYLPPGILVALEHRARGRA